MSDPAATPQLGIIRAELWEPHAAELKHVFLAGNLQHPVPHPFFRRKDVEVIICQYGQGDHGLPHWHRDVDEVEFIISGRLSYRNIADGTLVDFKAGDLLTIPRGCCVERRVDGPARTLAIKLPSLAEKVHCADCTRTCSSRREAYKGAAP